jgi:tight adherence protein B
MTNTIIVVGAFLSVTLLAAGIYMAAAGSRGAVLSRLGRATADGSGPVTAEGDQKSLREDFLWVLGQLGRFAPGKNRLSDIQANLVKAQVYMRAEEFVGLTVLAGAGFYALFFLLSDSVLLGIVGALVGLKLPGIMINSRKNKRSRMMTEQLPEALNIISSGLRAGFSFPQAVSIVVREMEPPLATEFSRLLRENRLGKPMDDALVDLLERVDNDDLELLVTALLIQRAVGGNLAEVLDSISHTIRERVRIKGEIRTLTAEGRISAVILCLLPVGVALAIGLLNPGYLSVLFQEPLGIAMIVGALILQAIGVVIISKIVAIDV